MYELLNTSGNFNTDAAKIIGVASKKLKRAASSLFNPAVKLPAIEEPAREIPGNKAEDWNIPIPTAWLQCNLAMPLSRSEILLGIVCRFFLSRSAPNRIIPLRINSSEAIFAEVNNLFSESWNNKPRIPAGMVATTSSQPIFA
jgi:hypothetical protein